MSKTLKEDCKLISIYKLKEWGYLNRSFMWGGVKWTNSYTEKESSVSFQMNISNDDFDIYIKLIYTITDSYTGEKYEINQKYPITKTHCNYGSDRYWFICSVYNGGVYCGRRVAKLYLGAGSHYFACRHCYDLTYSSRINGYSYTEPEMERYRKTIKRWYYRGEMTRKHRSLLKKEESISRSFIRLLSKSSLLKKHGML